jgi:subtilase family serine protease
MAGIQALINQKTHSRWGNPAYFYYHIASAQYGTTGNSSCNSNGVSGVASSCVFNDITNGDNDYPCDPGSPNCYSPSGTIGVLSSSTTSYVPIYPAKSGWDFATGLGSVNAYNLAKAWPVSSKLMIDILFDDCDSASNPACE